MSYRKYLMADDVPPSELYKTVKIDTDSDTISRQQAIDTLRGYLVGKRCPDDGTLTCRLIENEVINELPPVESKRIRGKWMHDGSKWKNRWICSNCGYKWFFDCIEGAFCPNCGADMEVAT